jgi:hypothetical protein
MMSLTIKYRAIVQRQQKEHNVQQQIDYIQRRSGALFRLLNHNYIHIGEATLHQEGKG